MSDKHKSPFVEYFANVWAGILTTYVGMRLTMRYFFRKSVTMEYPEVRPVIPAGHRGLHGFDESKCFICRGCEKACPVDCFSIEAIGRGKDVLITRFDIDYSRCLFCDLCTIPCPNVAIWMSERFDLAGYSRENCTVHFTRPKSAEEIAAHQAMLAKKEAEKKAKLEAAKAQPKPPPATEKE